MKKENRINEIKKMELVVSTYLELKSRTNLDLQFLEKTKTLFLMAIFHGHLESVKFCIEKGERNNIGILIASLAGQTEILKFLHENHHDIRFCNDYALFLATYFGHFKTVKYLIKNNLDPRLKIPPPFLSTKRREDRSLIEFLSNFSPYKYEYQNTYLYFGYRYLYLAKNETVLYENSVLLASVLHFNIFTYIIRSASFDLLSLEEAMYQACDTGKIHVVEFLLKEKVDPNGWGRGFIKRACYNNDNEIVKLFLNNGAKPSESLLEIASVNNNIELAELFIKLKVPVSQRVIRVAHSYEIKNLLLSHQSQSCSIL